MSLYKMPTWRFFITSISFFCNETKVIAGSLDTIPMMNVVIGDLLMIAASTSDMQTKNVSINSSYVF